MAKKELATIPKPATAAKGTNVIAIQPKTMKEAAELAEVYVEAKMTPPSLDTKQKCMIAIIHGSQIGLPAVTSIQRIAVINNRAQVWGEAATGIIEASGLCEWIKEWTEGEGLEFVQYVQSKRVNKPEPTTTKFTAKMAQQAGLLSKAGPWKLYPERMMLWRARQYHYRDNYADLLGGMDIAVPGDYDDASGTVIDGEPPAPELEDQSTEPPVPVDETEENLEQEENEDETPEHESVEEAPAPEPQEEEAAQDVEAPAPDEGDEGGEVEGEPEPLDGTVDDGGDTESDSGDDAGSEDNGESQSADRGGDPVEERDDPVAEDDLAIPDFLSREPEPEPEPDPDELTPYQKTLKGIAARSGDQAALNQYTKKVIQVAWSRYSLEERDAIEKAYKEAWEAGSSA